MNPPDLTGWGTLLPAIPVTFLVVVAVIRVLKQDRSWETLYKTVVSENQELRKEIDESREESRQAKRKQEETEEKLEAMAKEMANLKVQLAKCIEAR